MTVVAWDPAEHPRHPAGSAQGGEFRSSDAGSARAVDMGEIDGFPKGIYSPDDTVKFWPQDIGLNMDGPFWKAWMDPQTGKELAFWFVTPMGSPHHQYMARELGIPMPKVDEVAQGPMRLSGHGSESDLRWLGAYFQDDMGVHIDDARKIGSKGNTLYDHIIRSSDEIVRRHRKDMADAEDLAMEPLAASAAVNLDSEALNRAVERLARQYEKVYRRAAKRARNAYLAATKVVKADATPDEIVKALALVESFHKLTGAARRAMLGEVLDAFKLIQEATAKEDNDQDTHALELYLDLLQQQAGTQAERLVAGAQDAAASVLHDSLAQGWSVPQTADALKLKLESIAPWQATMLARTDLIALGNGASLRRAAILNDPQLQYKTWLATPDERTRINHRHAHGQTVPIQQPFTVGGEQLLYPGDPSASDGNVINCRCTVVYASSPAGPPGVQQIAMKPDLAISAAAWDESRHPRHPKGSEEGGEFASKQEATFAGQKLSTPFGDFGGAPPAIEEAHTAADAALDQEILSAVEGWQKKNWPGIFKPGVMISSPYRRNATTMSQARAIWRANGGDVESLLRVMESGEKWGTNWSSAYDEWDAAQQIAGIPLTNSQREQLEKATREGAKKFGNYERPPLSETDLKGFRARQAWHQQRFREAFGEEGTIAYRGVSGRRASKPWLEAGGESFSRRAEAEWKRVNDIPFEERIAQGIQTDYDAIHSDPVTGPQWGLSSWTEKQGDARQFAYGPKGRKPGVVLRARIKPQDIWMIPVFGGQGAIRFADVTGEYVVVNPEGQREAEIVNRG